ncbi:non-ribosomal peptide synthetase [Tumebacillus flagellatus]|uniref:Carrier domain-containing protein n=1 Tax=Tumebacillus flagellatus TaxID=1157490 RepID=A0A074LNA3_9BACL|nr:non-ribosomal peptide synthetase [Tumebacillus flagellatus]KEO82579.1 hypothetical protein EL26_14430 [Tumebacillus flagellatus]
MNVQLPQTSKKAPSRRLDSRSRVIPASVFKGAETPGNQLVTACALLFHRYDEREETVRLAYLVEQAEEEQAWQELHVDFSGRPQVHEVLNRVEDAVSGDVQAVRTLGAQELQVCWTEQARGFKVKISCDGERFDADRIDLMLRHLQALLTGMRDTPDAVVGDLPMLTAEERQEILVSRNETLRAFPQDLTLPELFTRRAELSAERVAVVFSGRELTYRELEARSNQLAHELQARGIGRGVMTGLFAERSLEMVIGMLAILKAGGICVPLDVQTPQERLQLILEDTQAQLILTQSKWVEKGLIQAERALCLDEAAYSSLGGERSELPPSVETRAEDTAFVIFTSGSTGVPKGVCVGHRGIARLVLGSEYAKFSEDEVMMQFASIAFDASFYELFGSLLWGAKLHVYPPGVPALHEFANYLVEHEISTLFLTTGLLHQLIEHHLDDLRGVRQLLTGGDVLSPVHYQKLMEQRPDLHFANLYGPTECSMVATAYLDRRLLQPGQFVPIGRPIANTTVYVLNAEMQPVPDGVPGELYIGGVGVANGYWKRPDLTAERFLADPFSELEGGRMYRTGDLVCWSADGNLEFLGRVDRQVKIRGFRLELGEIEAHLLKVESVREVAVLVHEDEQGAKFLAAYVVPEREHHPAPSELREALRRTLPEYMVPASYVLLEQFPLTANGKLDRKALPKPELGAAGSDADLVAPRTAEEAQVMGLCAEVMGLNSLSVVDSLLDLGAHSLMATQIVSRIRQKFGVELSIRQFLERPTVAALAEGIANGEFKRLDASVAELKRADRTEGEFLPLSSAQRRMWLLDQFDPGNPAYNIAQAWRFCGELDEEALQYGLLEVVQRHEILRTVFCVRDGEPMQAVQQAAELDWQSVEAADWEQHMKTEAAKPFDLQKGPLLRARFYRVGPQEQVCLLVMHHIVSDGWSMNVLVREWAEGYAGITGGAETSQTAHAGQVERLQYADYALWEQEHLDRAMPRHLDYWQQRLAGQSPLVALPYDRPRPVETSSRGRKLAVELPTELSQQLRSLSREWGVTLFMTLFAAFQAQLHRYGGQEEISVGTLVANRQQVETEAMIGFFVNTLVLRTDLSGNPTFLELLERVRRITTEAYEHQELPFEKLVEALNPDRQGDGNPLFHVLFVLHNESTALPMLPGLSAEPVRVDFGTSRFDLAVDVEENGEGLTVVLEYNTDLLEAETVERMAGHYQELLQGIVGQPEQRIAELPLLTAAERDLLVETWNQTTVPYDKTLCLHQAFEQQASRTPEAVAVVFEGESWTYEQLDRQANRVARLLQTHGVGPDVRVGIRMERSLSMIAGLLGILKAGGAYVPMDPSYPQERLLYMLEDAEMQVLVTQDSLLGDLPSLPCAVIALDGCDLTEWSDEPVESGTAPENLAYMIFTSGSTGRPKGVMVEHRNVLNFFAGMNQKIPCSERDTLLAVTSISFDISVLELFWTLSRGAKVVLISEEALLHSSARSGQAEMEFSLMYFNSVAGESGGGNSYQLLLDGAKFADQHGFKAVWTPERHFHEFGGLYPSPSVIGSALSMITERVELRAGSVVLPLNHPIRVAEEWSVVDNLSKGRVGLSFASGWHKNDFVLAPDNFEDRTHEMFRSIETVQKLWRGEGVTFRNGMGEETEINILPRPVQQELPVWVTSAGNKATFERAGKIGANVLTHLLGQSVEELAEKLAAYRAALVGNGHDPSDFTVTLMLHTFVGEDLDAVRERVREPFTNYLRSSFGLIESLAKSRFPDIPLDQLSEADRMDIMTFAFERYFETSGLFGTPETCQSMVEKLAAIGVNEIACLIDFGVQNDEVLHHLTYLNQLRERCLPEQSEQSLGDQAEKHGATMLQCTPSLMRLLLQNPDSRRQLRTLKTVMLGGEALPVQLAEQVKATWPVRLFNMYGPTETTIWSTVHEVTHTELTVPIGRPIANTSLYVLDEHRQLAPIGAAGELFIGGDGVTRGYWRQPELTAERFIQNPFSGEPNARLYRTGDLVRYQADGTLTYLSRNDHQVKFRGYRIELGEIETILESHPLVQKAVVLAHAAEGEDARLVGYVVYAGDRNAMDPELRRTLKERVPDYFVPSLFVAMDELPLTPNGKVDRKALPQPDWSSVSAQREYVAPRTETEQQVADIWAEVFGVERVGIHDDFFLLGGHSLLATKLVARIRQTFQIDLPMRHLFQASTVASLAELIVGEQLNSVDEALLLALLEEMEAN